MRKLKLLLLMIPLSLSHLGFSQMRTISGTVKSGSDDSTMPGVSVFAKGTTIGAVTDANGKYSLDLPKDKNIVVFSFIGFKTQEVTLTGSNIIDVMLEEDIMKLDEVVVTALGISKERKSLGYSTQQVQASQLSKTGTGDALNALSGKVAGLQVINSSGTAGASTYLKIRGTRTVTGDNQPLIVIDGLPISNVSSYSGSTADGRNNLLQGVTNSNRAMDINPEDIESVNVLKGGAASALYGVQGANGVIVITTKKSMQKGGKLGSVPHVEFSSSMSVNRVNRLPKLQDKYVQGSSYYRDENGDLQYGVPTWYAPDTPGDPDFGGYLKQVAWGAPAENLYWDGVPYAYDSRGRLTSDSNNGQNRKFEPYDNYGDFFKDGITLNNSLSLTGGNEITSFRFSLGHLNDKGVIPNNTWKRTTLGFSSRSLLTERLTADVNLNFVNSGGDRVQQGSNISGIMLGLSRTPISFSNIGDGVTANDPSGYLQADGRQRTYRGGGGYDNPFFTVNRNPFKDNVNRFYGNVSLNLKTNEYFRLNYRLGTDIYSDSRLQGFDINARANPSGLYFTDNIFSQQLYSDLSGTFSKEVSENFRTDIIVGTIYQSQSLKSQYTPGGDFILPNVYGFHNLSTLLPTEVTNTLLKNIAAYASVDLTLKRYLTLTLTERLEKASSIVDPLKGEVPTFSYPSASLAFSFTDPLGLTDSPILSYGKVRFSVAQVASIADEELDQTYYSSLAVLDGFTSGVSFPFEGTPGYAIGDVLGNNGLTPENTTSFDLGAELEFFKGKISVNASVYKSETEGSIIQTRIPPSTGYIEYISNSLDISNKGVELALNFKPVTLKAFEWNLGFNFSSNRSKIKSLGGLKDLFIGGFEGSSINAVEGERAFSIYGGKWLRDENGNRLIGEDGYPIVDPLTGVIGNTEADWIGGISNSFTFYKNITLSALIDIRQGGDIWNGTRGALYFFGTSEGTIDRGESTVFEGNVAVLDDAGNYVSTGTPNNQEVLLDENWYTGNGGGFGSQAEDFVEDGSFVRLREVSLNYTFNTNKFNGKILKGLELGIFGRNLLLATKYSGVDPETSLTGADRAQGMDYFNNPGIKTIGFNLKVKL